MQRVGFRTNWFETLARPSRAYRRMREQGAPAQALGAGLLLGLLWSAFSLALANEGAAPSDGRGLIVPADQYYATSALYLPVLFPVLTLLVGLVTHPICVWSGSKVSIEKTITAVGFSYAVPMTVFFIIPDIVVYMFAGHESLAGAMVYYVPVALCMTYERVSQSIRMVHGVSFGLAYLIALAPAIAQALPMAILVR